MTRNDFRLNQPSHQGGRLTAGQKLKKYGELKGLPDPLLVRIRREVDGNLVVISLLLIAIVLLLFVVMVPRP